MDLNNECMYLYCINMYIPIKISGRERERSINGTLKCPSRLTANIKEHDSAAREYIAETVINSVIYTW